MTRTRNRPELLLPAGEMASVIAAVQNGADAVYLGGVRFSARQNAKNFDEAALEEAVSYCHARGVKVYQTLNTLIFDGQMPLVRESIRLACRLGIDALIVQDWGVLALARETAPELLLHASTQMTVHTPAGAQMLKEMGASRVVLARELSEQEIREIVRQVEIETEVFVHGALCMSVSGQCYLSGMIGGRSGNRGNCAGTCRLPFSADGKPGHALSLKDLCLAGQVERLAEIGVTSLKVEGRMKRPEYVAAAAAAYSNAAEGEAPDLDTLQAVFSRSGFTNGYFTVQRGREMFGFRQKEDVLAATANDAWESYALDLPEDTANIGSPMKPSAELVLGAEPDLVIASSLSPSNLELQETFQRAGIPAAYFDVSSFQDYLDLLELFTVFVIGRRIM